MGLFKPVKSGGGSGAVLLSYTGSGVSPTSENPREIKLPFVPSMVMIYPRDLGYLFGSCDGLRTSELSIFVYGSSTMSSQGSGNHSKTIVHYYELDEKELLLKKWCSASNTNTVDALEGEGTLYNVLCFTKEG